MIYFIEAVGADAVKIGYSKAEPGKRLATMQTGSPHELRLLGVKAGDYKHERALHELFAAHRIRGEWFKLSRIAADIGSLVPADLLPTVRVCSTCGALLRSKHKQRHYTGKCFKCAHTKYERSCARCGCDGGGLREYGKTGAVLCATCVPIVKEERAILRRFKQSVAMQGNTNAARVTGYSARGLPLAA